MAAGLGFKDFTTGEVLTAADVDGYLMQGIWVFADSAARDAAVTSPQEGNFAFLKDTNTTTYYTGSAWTNLDTTGMVNPMTTTGDTIYSSSGSTPARLGIGTAGQVLQVNSGATAPEWATPASGGGMTLLETLTLSGASVTSSTIAGTYKNLALVVRNYKPASDGEELQMRFNSDSNTRYHSSTNNSTVNTAFGGDSIRICVGNDNSTATGLVFVDIYDYANTTTWKITEALGLANGASDPTQLNYQIYYGAYNQTGAITTLTFFPKTGNFTSGSVLIYGVS